MRVGLTGGIGSGKTAVAARLALHGAAVIDTDLLARALTAPGGAALPAIRARFGEQALGPDGGLERGWMRARVFADARERDALEAILHPLIRAHSEELAAHCAAPLLIVDIPLLAEIGRTGTDALDRVLVVDCPAALQRARVQARNGWPAAQVEAVLAAQADRAQRIALADDVVVNAGTFDALHARVDRLARAYLGERGAG